MDHRIAGIVRASLIRQAPDETTLHARLASVHTLTGIRRHLVRHCDRLRAEAAYPGIPLADRVAAARRVDHLQTQLAAILNLLIESLPPAEAETGPAAGEAWQLAADADRDTVIDLAAARAARGREG
jgi:hypothetical protein